MGLYDTIRFHENFKLPKVSEWQTKNIHSEMLSYHVEADGVLRNLYNELEMYTGIVDMIGDTPCPGGYEYVFYAAEFDRGQLVCTYKQKEDRSVDGDVRTYPRLPEDTDRREGFTLTTKSSLTVEELTSELFVLKERIDNLEWELAEMRKSGEEGRR